MILDSYENNIQKSNEKRKKRVFSKKENEKKGFEIMNEIYNNIDDYYTEEEKQELNKMRLQQKCGKTFHYIRVY